MSLYDDLMDLTLQGRSGLSLLSKVKLAGIQPSSHLKHDVVSALNEYLSDEQNIISIWKSLDNYEQDLFVELLRSGTIDLDDVDYIFSRYGMGKIYNQHSHYYSFDSFIPEDSKGRLFLFNRGIPKPIKKVLMQFVKPYIPTYRPIKSLPMDELSILVEIGESFATDFINLLQLINKKKLQVTKVNQYPTKRSMLEMNSVLTIKEWETASDEKVEDVRNVEKTIRLFGLFQLLKSSSLIHLKNNQILIGEKADTFLKLNQVEMCSLILEGYKNSQSIKELGRIPEHKLDWDYNNFKHCRELILKHLANCPLGEWISVQELIYTIKKKDRNFLHNAVKSMYFQNPIEYYYFPLNDWTIINERFIHVVLLEYLSMMGLVDVALSVDWDDFEEYYEVVYSRLTPFGGHVLGVNDEYKYKKTISKSGIVIQPNFEVIVSEGSMKFIHVIFFDGFAEKISNHPVPVYKISFKSIIKALDQGLKVQDIIDYLEKYKEIPIPQNVFTTLEDWRRESEKIRIRTVTVLEAQDPYLIEELKSYKTIGRHLKNDLLHTVEIEKKESKKIKREIEKKGRFCKLEE